MRPLLIEPRGGRAVRNHPGCVWSLLVCCLAVGLWCGTPIRAKAHPELDRALHLSAELDFEKALRAFDRALSSGTLSKPELVKLLAERALLLHALRRKDDVVRDFQWLAAIQPGYQLDERAPPDLTAVWESVRSGKPERTRVELSVLAGAGSQWLKPVIHGRSPEGLKVQTYYRAPPGSGSYQQHEGTEAVELPPGMASQVEAYAELIGPGRVVIDKHGSAIQPVLLSLAPASPTMPYPTDTVPKDDEHSERRKRRIWIASISAAVVAGVIIGVAVAAGKDEEQRTRLMPVATF